MFNSLYQYLLLHKDLSLPGIGSIQLQKSSSEYDFGNKIFTAPSYFFKMETGHQSPSKKLFDWLSKTQQITEWEAIRQVNEFSFDLKNRISAEGKVDWKNVGTFHRDDKGDIVLDSAPLQLESEKPVIAVKVIRGKAEHKILVGEQERTVIEMEEFFMENTEKKDIGWIVAIILIVFTIMTVGIYLSGKGISPSSTGNQSIIRI